MTSTAPSGCTSQGHKWSYALQLNKHIFLCQPMIHTIMAGLHLGNPALTGA